MSMSHGSITVRTRVRDGIEILNDWARGISRGIERIVELPEALEQKIIHTAPEFAPNRTDYYKAATEDGNPPWAIDQTDVLRSRFRRVRAADLPQLTIPEELEWEDGPYGHQKEAVIAWESGINPESGTISMANWCRKDPHSIDMRYPRTRSTC